MAATKTFEQNLKALEKVVEKLEEGTVSLDQSIDLFQKGRALVKACEGRLQEVELKVRELVDDEEGEAKARPMEGVEPPDDSDEDEREDV